MLDLCFVTLLKDLQRDRAERLGSSLKSSRTYFSESLTLN